METIASRVDAHVNVWYLLSLAGASRPSNRARNIDSQFGNEQKSGKAVPSHPFDSPSSPSSSSPNVLSALFPFLFSSFSSISTSLNRDTAFPVLVLSFLFSPFPPSLSHSFSLARTRSSFIEVTASFRLCSRSFLSAPTFVNAPVLVCPPRFLRFRHHVNADLAGSNRILLSSADIGGIIQV